MLSLYNDIKAKQFKNDPLKQRIYTSQLLGQSPELVLHGGGNTSVKITENDYFGTPEDILYVKGSGWDLATIAQGGFAPVKMETLLKLAELPTLTDTEMVDLQRCAMTNPNAPTPSVEAILHAIIPFTFVDHTHADSVVTISNSRNGEKHIREIYGENVLIVPYVMPGFVLARKIYELTQEIDWSKCEGMVLLNHGVFTFADEAKDAYEKMISLVTKAEKFLKAQQATIDFVSKADEVDPIDIARIRKKVSEVKGAAQLARFRNDAVSTSFVMDSNLKKISSQGPLTPDHVIRTKRVPVYLDKNFDRDIDQFQEDYIQYFKKHADNSLTMLDAAPRWAVVKNRGTLSFADSIKNIDIINDITSHTMKAILKAEKLGGYKALSPRDIFEVEYWELEQAKLRKSNQPAQLQGKVAVVTGAASGIGKACVQQLTWHGACVVAIDINPKVKDMFDSDSVLPIVADVTSLKKIKKALKEAVFHFGGIDIVISNAGIFSIGANIDQMKSDLWQQSMDVNLTSHQMLLTECIAYLKIGIDPSIIIIASKNVPAPGPGASAYSVAKAGLTQLARIAALELGSSGIRVNTIHPNQVFDTAIWTKKVLADRAQKYGLSVDEYKRNNLLKVEITSDDVAELACTMAGPVFAKTTGTQISIDGGNDRVI